MITHRQHRVKQDSHTEVMSEGRSTGGRGEPEGSGMFVDCPVSHLVAMALSGKAGPKMGYK